MEADESTAAANIDAFEWAVHTDGLSVAAAAVAATRALAGENIVMIVVAEVATRAVTEAVAWRRIVAVALTESIVFAAAAERRMTFERASVAEVGAGAARESRFAAVALAVVPSTWDDWMAVAVAVGEIAAALAAEIGAESSSAAALSVEAWATVGDDDAVT